ncbi:hypothetical protein AB0G00_32435 [Nocardia salmonicida]|uniref:DUF6941 family protein n=1 Tax=Nocardia salmonicida TaxID=53431 RepID=UPI003401D02B
MKLTILLADAAQIEGQTNKVNALGLGWKRTAFPMPPMAVMMLADFDVAELGSYRLVIELCDANGELALLDTGEGEPVTMKVAMDIEVATSSIVAEGEVLRVPSSVQLGPMPLTEGSYRFDAYIEGYEDSRVHESFRVLSND